MNPDTHYKLQAMLEYNEIDVLKDLGYTWNNLYDIIFEFEDTLASYTGAPYAVATDCCTHAMELCLRYLKLNNELIDDFISLPAYTYISVPIHEFESLRDAPSLGSYLNRHFKNVYPYERVE